MFHQYTNLPSTKTFYHNEYESNEYYLKINEKLHVTTNHPIFINGEWKKAESLKIGDMLLSEDLDKMVLLVEMRYSWSFVDISWTLSFFCSKISIEHT